MKISRSRFNAIISLFLVLCLLFTSCSIFAPKTNDDENKDDDQNNGGDNTVCTHAETVVTGEKQATCTEKGYTGDTVCKACTAVVTPGSELPILDHSYDNGRVTKQPTCYETGENTFTCTGCGTTQVESIPTVAHKDEYHDVLDGTHRHTCKVCPLTETSEHTPKDEGEFHSATCSEPAYTEYECSLCKGVYKVYDETKPATGHTYGDWELISSSTCSDTGLMRQSCTNDGCKHTNEIEIPESSAAHYYEFLHYAPAPNCTEDGYAVYMCRYCKCTDEKQVAKTGIHTYVPLENTGDGWVRKECSVCGDLISSFDASTLPKAELKVEDIDTDTALEMTMQNAAIQFPQDVVSQITSGTDVEISAGVVEGQDKTDAINKIEDEEKKAILENAPIYDFTVKVDSETFTDNFSTKVAITVPYDNGDEDTEGLVIYYLAENGEIEEITEVTYNPETKEITFFVDHFSYYAVAYVETQAMRCKRGVHEYEATGMTVEANCYSFGYTVYECVSCHVTTIDDIVERIAHNYGDIITANPTCENGDYVKRICQNDGCGDVLVIEFVGATGHTMDAPATCVSSSTCTKCGKVLARPAGHAWTEWETVVEPTELKDGIRRRWCTTCGKVDETILASTGNIEAISYDNYVDLLNLVLDDLLNVTSGKIAFSYAESYYDYTLQIDVEKTDKGYRLGLIWIITRYKDIDRLEIKWTDKYEGYYDNGVFVMVNEWDNGNSGTASSIEELIPYGIEIFKAALEDLHEDLDYYVREYLTVAREYLDEYEDLFGADINSILEQAGCDYTVDELHGIIDAVETVYAYISLKLGLSTSLEVGDGIALPTVEDFKTVLSYIMSATEKDGITTYSLSLEPMIETAKGMLNYLEEHAKDTVAEFVYANIGEALLEYNDTLISFDAIIDFIESEFPGTLTVSDAVDKIVAISEETGLFTLSDIYALIDDVILEVMGEEFDSEQFVEDNSTLSLDEFIQQATGEDEANIAGLYDAIIEYANTITLDELPYYNIGISLTEMIERFDYYLENIEADGKFSFSIDDDGNIVGLNLNQDLWIPGYDEGEYINIEKITASIVRDDSVKVTVPERFTSAMKDVKSYYDKNGNLVIEGLDPELDYDMEIIGNGYVSFKDAVELDETVSNEYGFDVYALKEEYWRNSNHVAGYYEYNGKYYTYDYDYFYVHRYDNLVSIDEYLENLDLTPDTDREHIGYLAGTTTEIPVYSHTLGIAYEVDGEWRISTSYGTIYGKDGYYSEYYITSDIALSDVKDNLTLSSTSVWSYYGEGSFIEIDGEYHDILLANFALENSNRTVSFFAAEVDGEIKIIESDDITYGSGYCDYYSYSSFSVFIFGNPIDTIPEYDEISSYNDTVLTYDDNGEIIEVNVKYSSFYKYYPTYFVKISDDCYLELNSSYKYNYNPASDAEETIELPDGNTLYVMGTDTENDYSYLYGYTAVYGYAEIPCGLYVQAIALYNGDEYVGVMYRGASTTSYIEYNKQYKVDDYTTYSNGKYVISSEMLEELKEFCEIPGCTYMICIEAREIIDGIKVDYRYYVGGYINMPELSLETMRPIDTYSMWYRLFNSDGTSSEYTVVKNDDGSITLVYNSGFEIKNIRYYFGDTLPAEDMLVRDDVTSRETGLEIYKYEISGSNTNYYYPRYLYEDGKYYEYSTESIYELMYLDSLESALSGWYISDMYYRFDMIGAEDLPESLSVYETTIRLTDRYYWWFDPTITVYTFFIDGKINVAVGAEVSGESLLTFESYMPLDEYIDSLVFELENNSWHYGTYNDVIIYQDYINIYETDENGNKIHKDSFSVKYCYDGTTRRYVYDYNRVAEKLIKRNEVTPDPEWSFSGFETSVYNGISYTFARYSYSTVTDYNSIFRFIKLAGGYYRYSYYIDGDNYYNYWDDYCYQSQRLDEWEFKNQALDKVWYYVVYNEQTGEETFYTEFIPSDFSFEPSGSIVDPGEINGERYSETFLGYTSEGHRLYEYAYYIDVESTDSGFEEIGLGIESLVKGDDDCYYTADGRMVFIAVNYSISWLGGNTLADCVNEYGDAYFDLTYWWDLYYYWTDSNGLAPLTLETYKYLLTTITGNTNWGETKKDALNYFVAETSKYTVEVQDDGTIFYHADGVGYLKDQAGYYVRARKVTLEDGSTKIVCFLRRAVIYDNVLNNYDQNWLGDYVTVERNKITFTEEFLELAASVKTQFNMNFELYHENTYYPTQYFSYYQLETLFMYGNTSGDTNIKCDDVVAVVK